jgi:hypothetical protein
MTVPVRITSTTDRVIPEIRLRNARAGFNRIE